MTAIQRKKACAIARRNRQRAKKCGWINEGHWVRQTWKEQVASLAVRLNVSKRSIWMAVCEVGLRRVTPSDIVAAHMRWRELVNLPMARLIKEKKMAIIRDPVTGRILKYEPVNPAA